MKAVHFGAGKIGRGFIADLLHDTGYEIVFVDVNEKVNEELNKYHNYYLYVIEEITEKRNRQGFRSLSDHRRRQSRGGNRGSRRSHYGSAGRQFP